MECNKRLDIWTEWMECSAKRRVLQGNYLSFECGIICHDVKYVLVVYIYTLKTVLNLQVQHYQYNATLRHYFFVIFPSLPPIFP